MTKISTPEQATKAMSKRVEKKTLLINNSYTKDLKPAPKDKAGSIKITNKSEGLVPKDSISSLRKKVESLTGTIVSQGVEIRSLKASVGSYKGANTKLRKEAATMTREYGIDSDAMGIATSLLQDEANGLRKSLNTAEGIIAERDQTIRLHKSDDSEKVYELGFEEPKFLEQDDYDDDYLVKLQKDIKFYGLLSKLAFSLAGLLLAVIIVGGIANGMGYI